MAEFPEAVEAALAQDRAAYLAARITEPAECSRCGRSTPTFRDSEGRLRLDSHRERNGVWCINGGRAAVEEDAE